ncbi:MAG: hypothetical protein AB7V42_02260 [Thermoleophilia bacterium]
MSARAGALLLVLAALLALPGMALGYGTTTTYAAQSAGTPPGAWANVPAAGSATDSGAAATLTESDTGAGTASTYPANRVFSGDASGWTSAKTEGLLATVTNSYDGGAGAPAGSLRSAYSATVGALGLMNGTATWTSDAFTYSGAAPATVGFSFDRTVVQTGVNLAAVGWTATLVDVAGGTATTLITGSTSTPQGWATLTAAGLASTLIVPGRTYRIRLEVTFNAIVSLASGMTINIDNVVLTVRPPQMRADGELRAPGVPVGSTQTLEIRARTTAEPFDVLVWNGTAWTGRATISAVAPSWDAVSYGLTPAERNGGTVRVRFVDTATGADATADVLSIDYMRIVSTGGITVSGPATVTMPSLTLDGASAQTSSVALGQVEVVDSGGGASGWTLAATATRWARDGAPADLLPAGAFTATTAAPTTPDGSDLTGVVAGAGGTFGPTVPITLMSATAGHGVGTFRQNPTLALVVPPTASFGVYRSTITLTAS